MEKHWKILKKQRERFIFVILSILVAFSYSTVFSHSRSSIELIAPKRVAELPPERFLFLPRKFLLETGQFNVDYVTLNKCATRIRHVIEYWDQIGFPVENRSLVIYHFGEPTAEDPSDVTMNNWNLFFGSLSPKLLDAFVIVNKVGESQHFLSFVDNHPAICVVSLTSADGDMSTHMRTIAHLNSSISSFGSVMGLNQGVRGPLRFYENQSWVRKFNNLLKRDIGVMLVGASLSCEIMPHVQSHFFAIASEFIPYVLAYALNPPEMTDWKAFARHFELGMSSFTLKAGFKLNSMLYAELWNQSNFHGTCHPLLGQNNPTGWCDLDPTVPIFVKWGGSPLRMRHYCHKTVKEMKKNLLHMSSLVPNLIVPEKFNSEYDTV
jgi:hypothetical protein